MDYSFGNWVKRRRKGLDLTQQELAQRVGCSVSLIFKIESDERRPSHQIAGLLAQHLEIPPDERDLFFKVARQEKAVDGLASLSPLSAPGAPRPSRSSNLPLPLTPLIGREHELRAILQQLQDPSCHLLTLSGPGGVGKTRLALEAAHRMCAAFADGAAFVSMVGTSDSEFIIPAIAGVLGCNFPGMGEPKQQLLHFLRDKQLLLVLDNLEHLLDGMGLLEELLGSSPGVRLLTTSREPLNLRAEWVFEVQGMPVPARMDLADYDSNSAAALFVLRARQANVGFDLAAEDLPSIKRICQLVDGLPLGLELAAAWVRTMPVTDIAEEIGKGLDFLTSNVRDLPQRHRSMRAVFDQSWSLLTEEERRVMEGLSVFRGGFTRDAAEKVTGATLFVLSSLVEKSLLRHTEARRYDLHELMRQYAHEKLTTSGRLDEARDRHFEYFLSQAQGSRTGLRGPEQLAWLDHLGQDYDNLRAALEWSLRYEASPGDAPEQTAISSLKLVRALHSFWRMRAHWSEGRKWLQRALDQSAGQPASPERVEALRAAALLAVDQADTASARRLADENLALARALGDARLAAQALHSLGLVLWKQKDFPAARLNCEQALAEFRALDLPLDLADTLRTLGHITTNQDDLEAAQVYVEECAAIFQSLGNQVEASVALSDLGLLAYLRLDLPTARSCLQKSLVVFREAGDVADIELALNRLGDIARCEDDFEQAQSCYEESLAIYQKTGDMDEIPSLLHNLGYVAKQRGDHSRALGLFKEALAIQSGTGNQAGIAECIEGIASVHAALGEAERSAHLFGLSELLREKAGAVLWPANRIEHDRSLAVLRGLLGEAALTAAWAEGRLMPLEQTVAQLSVIP